MAESDFLFEVGVDTNGADRQLADFIGRNTRLLDDAFSKNIVIQVNTKAATDSIAALVASAKTELTNLSNINLNIKLTGSKKAFNDFLAAVNSNIPALEKFSAMLQSLEGVINSYGPAMERGAASMIAFKDATNEARLATRTMATDVNTITKASGNIVTTSEKVKASLKGQGDAFGFLQKVASNTVFKFLEYQVAMDAFTGAVEEFQNAFKQAADVQIEQKLQGLYGGFVNTNAVLRDSVILARQWGDTIQDVQQSIGMWSKVTKDQATAEYLANEALKLHAASGIATNDVTITTISLMQKLHTTAGEIPQVFDQVTKAAELMGLPMKNLGTTSGTQEGIREVLEGLTESSATLRAEGLDTASSIAIVAATIQGLGETGKQAGLKLSQLFQGLEVGKSGKTFDDMIANDTDSLKKMETTLGGVSQTGNDFLDKILDPEHGKERAQALLQAIKDGVIAVRPQVREALMNLLSSTDLIKSWRDTLRTASKGALNEAALSLMDSFSGASAKMQASLQALTIEIGTQLLPAGQRFVEWLGNSAFPWLTANTKAILDAAEAGLKFFGVLIAWQGLSRTGSMLQGLYTTIINLGTAQLEAAAAAQKAATAEGEAAVATASVGEAAAGSASGIAVFSAGLGALAVRALALLGPLAALYAITLSAQEMASETDIDKFYKSTIGLSTNTHDAAAMTTFLQDRPGFGTHQRISNELLSGNGPLSAEYQQAIKSGSASWQMQIEDKKLKADQDAANLQSGSFNNLLKTIQAKTNLKMQIPGQPQDLPGSTLGGNSPGSIESEASKILAAVADEKRGYMALISTLTDVGKADENEIKTTLKLAEHFGFTKDTVATLAAEYKKAITDKNSLIVVTQNEIAALQKRLDVDQQNVNNTQEGTKVHAAAVKALSEDQAALDKATGAVQRLLSEKQALYAQEKLDIALAATRGTLDTYGVGNYDAQFRNLERMTHGVKGDTNNLSAVTQQAAGLRQLDAGLQQAIAHPLPGVPQATIDSWKSFDQQVQQSLENSTQGIDTWKLKLVELSNTIFDKANALGKTNFTNIAEAMGLTQSDVDYVTQMADGYQTIQTENQEIQKYRDEAGDQLPQIRDYILQQVDAYQKQVDLQTQLLPLLAQEKAIRASEEFQATNSVLGKYASAGLDHAIDGLFQNLQKKHKDWLHSMLSDWIKEIANASLKKGVESFTDTLFGNKQEQITKLYGQYVASYGTSVNLYGGFTKNFTDAVQEMVDNFGPTSAYATQGGGKSGVVGTLLGAAANGAPFELPTALLPGVGGFGIGNIANGIGTGLSLGLVGSGVAGIPGLLGSITSTNVSPGGGGGLLSGIAGAVFGPFAGLGPLLGPIGDLFGAASVGGGLGAAIGGNASSNQSWGAIGSILGVGLASGFSMAGLGALASGSMGLDILGGVAGPIGLLIAALAGGAIGGLFGNHEQAFQMPDVTDTSNYGQFVSNMNGAPGTFNGQTIAPLLQYSTAHGNADLSKQLSTYVDDVTSTQLDKLSPQLEQAVMELKKLNGGKPDGLSIQSESQGIFTLASGQKIGVSAYEQLTSQVEKAMDSSKSALAPILSFNAFGAGPGYSPNPYNTPGLTAKEFAALQQAQPSPFPGYGPAYFGLPYASGFPGSAGRLMYPGGSPGGVPISGPTQTINLVVDGKILASIVTSYQTAMQNRYNQLAA